METSDILTYLMQAGWAVASFFNPKTLISYQNVLIPVLIISAFAYAVKRRGKSVKAFLFPESLRHAVSVRMDVFYYLLIIPLGVFVLIPAVSVLQLEVSDTILNSATSLGVSSVEGENPAWAMVLYSALVFLCMDFGFYISHLAQHKWRFLWAFHKVHHSPTHLIFLSAARFHPVDILWNVGVSVLLIGIVSSLAQLTFYSGEEFYRLFGNHVVVAISYLTTHNFRHSHFWIHYPKWLNFLMSPAQHQIHHSCEARHLDKNMGYLLTCWDRWFGTLYEPAEREMFRLGVHDVPERGATAHDSVWKMLWLPCKEAWGIVRKRDG